MVNKFDLYATCVSLGAFIRWGFYPLGLLSVGAFIRGAFARGAFVRGAFVRAPVVLYLCLSLFILRWMACEKIVIFFNFIKIAKHTYSYAKFIVNFISENRFYLSCLKLEIFSFS